MGYIYKPNIDPNMTLGEAIAKLKELGSEIKEVDLINPYSHISNLILEILIIIKNLEIPELIGRGDIQE